jgi:hypothetical protein
MAIQIKEQMQTNSRNIKDCRINSVKVTKDAKNWSYKIYVFRDTTKLLIDQVWHEIKQIRWPLQNSQLSFRHTIGDLDYQGSTVFQLN